MKPSSLPYLLIILFVALGGWLTMQFRSTLERQSTGGEIPAVGQQSPTLSTSETTTEASPTKAVNDAVTPAASPTPISNVPVTTQAIYLSVPFTIQAPDGDWVEPWKEGCEEAALLMADAFNKGDKRDTLPSLETKQKIAEMVEWEKKRFGGHKDLGVDQMAVIAKEYMGYKEVTVKKYASLEDIKDELRRGKPVIMPFAGRLLDNPYFRQPGPYYHVFLMTGFEADVFIANENGTRRGHNYRYSTKTLQRAWHDYLAGVDITQTPTAYLVLER